MRTTPLRPVLTALLILLGLAVVLTYPLPLHWATHAPGDGSDDPAILWNLWWVRFALTELRQSPFQSAWMFYPLGINLVFYTLTTLNGILSIPLQLAFGIVPANSFVVYFELVMAALGMWLLMRWLMSHHPESAPFSRRTRDGLALLAAIVYTYSTSKWLYLSLGQFNIASSHWIPWSVLYLCRMWNAPTTRRGIKDSVMCAFFTLCTGWTEFTYASFFVQFAALLWGWLMLAGWKNKQWATMRAFTLRCVLLGGLFLLGMSPILYLMVQDMRVNGDFLVEGLGFSNIFSNDVLGFFVPGNQHPLFGEWVSKGLHLSYLNFAFVGWVTLALVVISLLSVRTRANALYWSLFAAIFGLLSLGPTLRLNGQEWDLPMPFDLMLQIPLVKANRYPSRYSVMIMLCLAVAATWGAAAVLAWWQRRQFPLRNVVVAGIAGLILFEHFGAPLPLSNYEVPPVYKLARQQPGGTLLDIPLVWRNGFRITGVQPGAQFNSFMFAQAFQTYHEKRMLSGNTSRNPELKFQYFTELPVINSLIALETGNALPDGRIEHDQPVAAELLRLLDAPTMVIWKLDSDTPSITPEATLPYLQSILTTSQWYEDDDYVGLSAALPSAPDSYTWDAHHPLARLFFAEGWSALPPLDVDPADTAFPTAMYAEQDEARLFVPAIAAEGDWTLQFTATVPSTTPVTMFAQSPDGGAEMELAQLTLEGTNTYSVTIPATAPRGPLTGIIFRFGTTHAISDFANDLPYSLLVESAGLPTGNFAHIYVNGVDVVRAGTGYHAALIQSDGTLLDYQRFDTFTDPTASTALATFLNNAPDGVTLALAASDTVSHSSITGGAPMGSEVLDALRAYGATEVSNLQGKYAWSHAFIGVKGGGQPWEDSSGIRPSRVTNGLPFNGNLSVIEVEFFTLKTN